MSLLENFGFICLIITMAAMFIVFVTPYWVVDYGNYIMKPVHKCLLANCEEDMCTWFFKDERISSEFPVITDAAVFISFVTPYWVVSDGDHTTGPVHNGLLATCEKDSCTVIYNDGRIGSEFPAWFKATQGLMSVALVLGLLALLVATLSLCCTCHSCNPHQPICGFLIVASVAIAVGIVIFGIKARHDWSIDLQVEKLSRGRFGWSFWTAIGATASALLTSTIYCCMERKRQ